MKNCIGIAAYYHGVLLVSEYLLKQAYLIMAEGRHCQTIAVSAFKSGNCFFMCC